MSARVKLLTVWDGPLPKWYPRFRERVGASRVVEHELVTAPVATLNGLASAALGTPCRKLTAYSQCDLRPMYGVLFEELLRGYEWWGWIDLDVMVGDLDRLLPLLLDTRDVITTAASYVHGPMTMLRNIEDVTRLYEFGDEYKEVLADPDYWNFDETGFNDDPAVTNDNPSFDWDVKDSPNIRVHYDDRSWTETSDPLPDSNGVPSRGCEMFRGRTLREVPTNRELLMYHFNRTPKTWPEPNRWNLYYVKRQQYIDGTFPARVLEPNLPGLPDLPPDRPEYWDARVEAVLAGGLPTHLAVYDTSETDWDGIQQSSAVALRDNVPAGSNVLDVGCGYGALSYGQYYGWTGIDVSPLMVELARSCCDPVLSFFVADARALPFAADEFDWCVCRGLEGSVRTRVGNRAWAAMRTEMLRVAPRVLLIDYSRGHRVLRRGDYQC